MKTNPVRPFRLSISLLIPVLSILISIFITVRLVDATSDHPLQTNHTLSSFTFSKEDSLVHDADQDGVVTPGDTIQYTLAFSNNSKTALTQLQITDTVDVHTTYLADSLVVSPLAFADTFATAINTVLDVPAPGLLANDQLFASESIISAMTTTTAGGTVQVDENGRFTYTPPPDFIGQDSFHYTLENDAGTDMTIVTITVVDSDLRVDKVVDQPSPFAGEEITYTLKAQNEGATQLTNIVISDTLPIGIAYKHHIASDGTSYNPATGFWSIPQLNIAHEESLQIIALVEAGTARQTITNTAVLASLDQVDSNPLNNQQSAAITVQPLVDVAIQKDVNDDTPLEGETILYTILATNDGPDDATGVQISDMLPDGVTYLSSNQPTFNPPIWEVGSIGVGQTVTLNINAKVNSLTVGNSYTNTATVTAVTELDANIENNSDDAIISVVSPPHAVDDTSDASPPVNYKVISGNILNTANTSAPTVLNNDELGIPAATVVSFGYPNGNEQTVGGGTTPTQQGGTVEIFANGDFIYSPANHFQGRDRFSYRIENSAGQSVAKVEVDVLASTNCRG